MRFTLKPYQSDAVSALLRQVGRGLRDWRTSCEEGDDPQRSAVVLSAITGAGKTVIATAVLEALLKGADEPRHLDPDRRLAVLWLTDDPVLNRQTAAKMLDASSRFTPADLLVLDDSFDAARLDAGRIHFVNIHRFSAASNMTKPSELRKHSLWDTVADTALAPDVDLLLVLDEAHKGMKPAADRATIVTRIVNGEHPTGRSAPVPVVWGISATPDRFTAMLGRTRERTVLPQHDVDIDAVRASGLLKHTIVLDRPAESGEFDTTTLRTATTRLIDSTAAWARYCAGAGEDRVVPVMVLQVPDSAKPAAMAELVGIVESEWSARIGTPLEAGAVVNVLGEHEDLALGARTVRYVSPEQVQDDDTIRVVLAKTAVTTGWDCPRAEVLFSLRPASDPTHIAQMVGRIVRTPLARSIDEDDSLNDVHAFLPMFHKANLAAVIDRIAGRGSDDSGTGAEVVVGSADIVRNPAIDSDVFDLAATLPSWAAPGALKHPLSRLRTMSALLAADQMVIDPAKTARESMCGYLDGVRARYRAAVDERVRDVRTMAATSTRFSMLDATSSETTYEASTDAANVEDAFRKAGRSLPQGVAEDYLRWCLRGVADPDDDDILEAKVEVAALCTLRSADPSAPDVGTEVARLAEKQIDTWDNTSRAWVRAMLPARRAEYAEVLASSGSPFEDALVVPETGSAKLGYLVGGEVVDCPSFNKHLLCERAGSYPVRLNGWESGVLAHELAGCTAWYRNPSRAGASSLRIAYQVGREWRSMQPDFVFFYTDPTSGQVSASIVDPHGTHLSDSVAKLKGLAAYAGRYPDRFVRIESVGVGSDNKDAPLLYLDMLDPDIRDAVLGFSGTNATDIFAAHGRSYLGHSVGQG